MTPACAAGSSGPCISEQLLRMGFGSVPGAVACATAEGTCVQGAPRCPRREAAHLASVVTRPSLPVLVQLLRWQFMLSSASSSLPRYVSPFLSSMVTVCPSASCSTLMGMPMCLLMLLARGDLRAGTGTAGSGGALPPSADSQTTAGHPCLCDPAHDSHSIRPRWAPKVRRPKPLRPEAQLELRDGRRAPTERGSP